MRKKTLAPKNPKVLAKGGESEMTKKELIEENEELRDRLREMRNEINDVLAEGEEDEDE
jgi:hypothetical protein